VEKFSLELLMKNEYSLGIDIGGTGVEYGLVTVDGKVIYEKDFATKKFARPEDLVDKIFTDLVIQENLENITGIGIGAPNGNFYNGTIEFAPNLDWKGIIPLVQMFEEKFNKPAVLTNDANAAAIGEMTFGNAKDLKDFVTITLGTGVGSGVVVNGQLVYGHDGFAGEYGHIRVIPNGRKCGCGRKGCLETYASSTGVVRSIQELDSDNKPFSALANMENPKAKDVFDLAKEGDLFATEIFEFTAQTLGSALADYACFSSPKAYILFGGLAQSGPEFAKRVKHHMEENMLIIFKDKVEIRISSLHEQNAAVLGAASLAFQELQVVKKEFGIRN
jgi:glucokinase